METSSQSAKKEGRQRIINHKTKQCVPQFFEKKSPLHFYLKIFLIPLHSKNIKRKW